MSWNAPANGLLAVCGPRRNASAIIGRIDQQRAELREPTAPGVVAIVGPSLNVEAVAEIALAPRPSRSRVEGLFTQWDDDQGMDYLATIPPIVGVISNLSAITLQLLAERLLTILLAGLVVGSVGIWALTELAWLLLRRALGELHVLPRALPR